jgi:hypothetical protein
MTFVTLVTPLNHRLISIHHNLVRPYSARPARIKGLLALNALPFQRNSTGAKLNPNAKNPINVLAH